MNEQQNQSGTLATILGLSPLVNLLSFGVLLNVVAPLILWLIWKDKYPALDKTGKNVLNSQLSWLLWLFIAGIISFPLMLIFIGYLTYIAAFLVWLVFTIIHAIKIANGDQDYTMPMSIKFLK